MSESENFDNNRFNFFAESDSSNKPFFERAVQKNLQPDQQIIINFVGKTQPTTHIEHKVFNLLTKNIRNSEENFQSTMEKAADLIQRSKVIAYSSITISDSETNANQTDMEINLKPFNTIRHRINYAVGESEAHAYPVCKGTLLYDNMCG